MNILINASNLVVGGALQVADSICCSLNRYEQHKFVVVLSKHLRATFQKISSYTNLSVHEYTLPKNMSTMLRGRDRFLDKMVEENHIDAVLTIFGPSYWIPRCQHLMGFARPHYVMPDSPFYKTIGRKASFMYKIHGALIMHYFKKCSPNLYTENPYISRLLQAKIPGSTVYTVTNYYNQLYDNPTRWVEYKLPPFEGTTLFAVSVFYPHKNFRISVDVARILKEQHPDFKFRFVFAGGTKEQFGEIPAYLESHFIFTGRVDLAQCPSLYKQADIMFMPTLLECFSATYPEAMTMGVPIVTTDLPFARGLCGEAALYYSPIDAADAADKVYTLATDQQLQAHLVQAGKEQLKVYDNYNERSEKLIHILQNF